MAFCEKCGREIAEGNSFCPGCGAPVANAAQAPNPANPQFTQGQQNQQYAGAQPGYQQPPQGYQGQPYQQPSTPEEADIAANKGNAVLAYIGILVLFPIFSEKGKNSPYARFHVGQGLTLTAASIAYGILDFILSLIVNAIFPPVRYYFIVRPSGIATAITTILGLASLFFLAMMIVGIVNAASGKKTKLPILGNIDIISKYFDK